MHPLQLEGEGGLKILEKYLLVGQKVLFWWGVVLLEGHGILNFESQYRK